MIRNFGMLFFFVFATAEAAPQRVFMISIDGFRPEFYLDSNYPAPTLRSFTQKGAYASDVESVFPTVTYPNHTSLITGVPPADHGVLSNTLFDFTDGPSEAWYWEENLIKSPTLWHVLRKHGKKSASVRWPVTVNAAIDYLVPEIFPKPPYYVGSSWDLTVRLTSSALMTEIQRATGLKAFKNDLEADVWATTASLYLHEKYKPDLTLLHLIEADHAQHGTGRDSQETKKAVAFVDGEVKRVLDGVNLQETCVLIVGDHGFFNISRGINLNKLFVDKGWIETETKDGKTTIRSWTVIAQKSGGQAAIYTKNKGLEREIAAVLDANKSLGFNVVTKSQLNQLGAYPEAIMAVEAHEGYTISGGLSGQLVEEIVALKGQHGYLPHHPKLKTGFLAQGCQIEPGLQLGSIKMLSIAPTVGKLLGVSTPTMKAPALKLKP